MDLAANLASVQETIARACRKSGRNPAEVLLLAVTKNQEPAIIRQAFDLGLRFFGENRVQEAKAKIGMCPGQCRWHFIGHLQSNKCRDAVHFFEMIQSVDSLAIAEEIHKWADKAAKNIPVLLEVNIAGEASKFGYPPERLLSELKTLNDFSRLEIYGLMTMAPWGPDPEKVRPIFRRARELKTECEQILGAPLSHLSMGMSEDYEVAVEEGATIVRIGTALFGKR